MIYSLRPVLLQMIFLLVWNLHAHAATYFVSKGGQDSHSCAQAQNGATAKLTVQQGISCLAGGDILVIGDGIYHEQISDVVDDEHPGTVRPPSGLSWERPTTIRAQHLHKATLDKPQAGDPYNHVVMLGIPDTQYLSLEGLNLDSRGHGACVWVGPASHIRLAGNRIVNCGGNGIYGAVADDGSGGTDIQIVGNEIANVAMEICCAPGSHSIYFTGNYSRIAANYIHGCPFNGIQASSEHGGLHHNIFENNRVKGCGQAGILNQGGESVTRNNLLEGNGIGVQCNGAASQLVAHNTIYGWQRSEHNGDNNYGILDLSGGCTISNNIILQQNDWSMATYIYWIGNPTLSGNLCDGLNPQPCQSHVDDYSTVLVDAPGGDLRLKEGSPAIDRTTPLTQVPMDRLRTARPQGAAADLGAFEGTGGTLPPIPPDPPDPPDPPAGGAVPLACAGLLAPGGSAVAIACAAQSGKR
jgi:hypothetical protein